MAETVRDRYPLLCDAAQSLASQKRLNDAYVLLEVEARIPAQDALEIRALCVPQIPRPRPLDIEEHEAFHRAQRRLAVAAAQRVRDELSRVEGDRIRRPSMRELANACVSQKMWLAGTHEVLAEVCADG